MFDTWDLKNVPKTFFDDKENEEICKPVYCESQKINNLYFGKLVDMPRQLLDKYANMSSAWGASWNLGESIYRFCWGKKTETFSGVLIIVKKISIYILQNGGAPGQLTNTVIDISVFD
jgi:hypothetical protein